MQMKAIISPDDLIIKKSFLGKNRTLTAVLSSAHRAFKTCSEAKCIKSCRMKGAKVKTGRLQYINSSSGKWVGKIFAPDIVKSLESKSLNLRFTRLMNPVPYETAG